MTNNMQSQFKTLVENELSRLRSLAIPPVSPGRQTYTESFQNATLVLRQIKNKGGFSRVLKFLSFF